jgi:ATP-dependent DNA ligase
MLSRVLAGSKRIVYAEHLTESPAALWAMCKHFALEGIVAKHGSSPYVAGRSDRWLKIKTAAGAERERQRRPK